MLRMINCSKTKAIVEVKVFLNKKFIGYASMLEFGFIGGCEKVIDLPPIDLQKIEARLCRIWVNKAGY